MSRITYVPKKFSPGSRAVIAHANIICAEYAAQGYDLTLRQLYYQFVARGLIANRQSEYKRLGSIINDARMAGNLDWNYIVDRTRNVEIPAKWDTPADIVDAAASTYAIDRWEDQPYRVEVWVEKEALAGVIERAAGHHRVPTFSCRGYISQSELWGAAQRLRGYLKGGQMPVIIHLGDHDPSGIDMTRDIFDRLDTFLLQDWLNNDYDGEVEEGRASVSGIKRSMLSGLEAGVNLTELPVIVNRIALNMDQVEAYDPPPNPTKFTDSRASSYVEQYGYESWELDALDPATLHGLVEDTIEDYLDEDRFEAKLDREEAERKALKKMAKEYRETMENGEEE